MAGEPIVQRGRWFDELEVGMEFRHTPGRTCTEADDVLFSSLTMNTQGIHLDAHWSAGTEFGQRLMNSMWTLATLVGMSGPQVTQGTIVAQLGFEKVTFPHPLFHGDTLYGSTRVDALRASSSRPGQGIATLTHTGRNQDGTVVAVATRNVLMNRRPEEER